eukprot:jgi/Chlat1/8255/Chrsp77S07674
MASSTKTRVVEHVVLFKMGEDFDDRAETDMLDNLYTLQYMCPSVLAISVGANVNSPAQSGGYTHALYVRFPDMAALDRYLVHPAHLSCVETYVKPFVQDTLAIDFQAEVDNDINTVFRRGDDWDQGVEHLVLLKVKEGTTSEQEATMLERLQSLPQVIGESVLQITAGANFSTRSKGYTHGLVARCPSEEHLHTYARHPEHRTILRKQVLPISDSMPIAVDFVVNPLGVVGRENIM